MADLLMQFWRLEYKARREGWHKYSEHASLSSAEREHAAAVRAESTIVWRIVHVQETLVPNPKED